MAAVTAHQRPQVDAIHTLIAGHAQELSEKLQRHRYQIFPPAARKAMRKFSSGEVATLLGIDDGYLRKLSLEGKGPAPELSSSGRRLYSVAHIRALRQYLDETGKGERRYMPGRRKSEHLQVIAIANFKGGSGKTTTSAHLSQYLALQGYRVLCVDLDPQASLSALHGYQPEFDVSDNESIYSAIRYDAHRRSIKEVIKPSYFPGLDIVPASLELMLFEHETPKALMERVDPESLFFTRLDVALSEIADQYDIVIIDCPPQLGFLTLSALCAATAVLVTVHPQMLDVMSMCQFLLMTSELMETVADAGGNMRYDWMRYLVTRYEPGDGPQTQMVAFMRSMFGEHVLNYPMLKSTAVSDAGITQQTLYEVNREAFTRATYDRAVEAMNNVNGEIESLIKNSWGRS